MPGMNARGNIPPGQKLTGGRAARKNRKATRKNRHASRTRKSRRGGSRA
jgi:hypothetical protein